MKEYFEKFKEFCEGVTTPFDAPWWVLPVAVAFVLAVIF